MSAAAFLNNRFSSLNWKLWAVASFAASVMLGYNLICGQNVLADSKLYNDAGATAEKLGLYKEAKIDYELALERARESRDKEFLAQALINISRIESYFENDEHATALASEALGICKQIYGDADLQTAQAEIAVANACPSVFALNIYKKALPILKAEDRIAFARALREFAYCLDETDNKDRAISACKAALKIFASQKAELASDYALSLIQYADIVETEASKKEALLTKAASIQEQTLGKSHPELAVTLMDLSLSTDSTAKRIDLQKRALDIDSTTFGDYSNQAKQDLLNLAKSYKISDDKSSASKVLEKLLAQGKDHFQSASLDFLTGYAQVLHELKFQKESERIEKIIACNFGKAAFLQDTERLADKRFSDAAEYESDPEAFWQKRYIPIVDVAKFETTKFDHIVAWRQNGIIHIETYAEGEPVYEQELAKPSSEEVSLLAHADLIELNSQIGDTPVWKKDSYRILENSIKLEHSNEEDAYSAMLNTELTSILNRSEDSSTASDVVGQVPVQYLNNNFIADVIERAEHQALKLYGQGNSYDAAKALSAGFDFTLAAINAQRECKADKDEPQLWLDAWKWRHIPSEKYITALNDYGFYLMQSNRAKEAITVLEAVTTEHTQRSVAWLNLGDALWNADRKAEAVEKYQHYLSLNKLARKAIPLRVIQRTSTAQKYNASDS